MRTPLNLPPPPAMPRAVERSVWSPLAELGRRLWGDWLFRMTLFFGALGWLLRDVFALWFFAPLMFGGGCCW